LPARTIASHGCLRGIGSAGWRDYRLSAARVPEGYACPIASVSATGYGHAAAPLIVTPVSGPAGALRTGLVSGVRGCRFGVRPRFA